jgi:cellulose synthase/poly-beta-1,6-N-acetylglucosamine synthase-like glycosyltransferase
MLAYKNKALCKVRTITTFLSLTSQRQRWHQEILQASTFCTELAHEFQTNHYQV